MKKELPKLYKGNVNNTSNRNVAYGLKEKEENVEDKINKLFRQNEIYRQDVIFKTNKKDYNTKIIGRTKDHIITLENEVIKIKDIMKIEVK